MVFARTAQEEDEQEAPGERRRPDEDARAGHRREKQRHLAGHLEEDEAYQPVRRPKDDSREAQAYPSLAASRVRTRRRVKPDSPSRETHGTPEYGIDVLITGHPLAIAST